MSLHCGLLLLHCELITINHTKKFKLLVVYIFSMKRNTLLIRIVPPKRFARLTPELLMSIYWSFVIVLHLKYVLNFQFVALCRIKLRDVCFFVERFHLNKLLKEKYSPSAIYSKHLFSQISHREDHVHVSVIRFCLELVRAKIPS